MHPAVFGLGKRFFHDVRGNAGNLDVHLQRGDTGFGTRDFEVHIAQVILVAKDIGQNCIVAIVFKDQPHRNAGNR